MNTSKFLTELRRIIREEISFALDEIKAENKKTIKEALMNEVKSKPSPSPKKKTTTSGSSIKSADRDLINSVKASMNGKKTTKSAAPTSKRRESIVESKMKNLPTGVMAALAETEDALVSGRAAPIGSDQQGDSIVMQEHAMFMDRAEIAEDGYESQLEFGEIRRTSDDVAASIDVDFDDDPIPGGKSWKAILDKSMEMDKARGR